MKFVKWQEKQSDSGIQVIGPSTIERRGEVLSTQVFPMQQGGAMGFMVMMAVRRSDTNMVVVINGLECVFYDPMQEYKDQQIAQVKTNILAP